MRLKLLVLSLLLALSARARAEEPDFWAMAEPVRILSVAADRKSAPAYEGITLHVDLRATYSNPFASTEIRLDAEVRPPRGPSFIVPGFLYQPYSRRLEAGREIIEPAGPPSWQIRLTLVVPGRHRVFVVVRDRNGTARSKALHLTCKPVESAGFVRRHPRDHRYFVTDRGETCFLVGLNLCWSRLQGTFAYDRWLEKLSDAGGNYFSLAAETRAVTFGLCAYRGTSVVWGIRYTETDGKLCGFDRIHLGNAWRLDYVLALAERYGMRVKLCLEGFAALRPQGNSYGRWDECPYNARNGGPLQRPRDFFTHPLMQQAVRDRLRYMVARWGGSPSVLAWELFNEVDLTWGYDRAEVVRWHRETAAYLRQLDPWDHLITTGYAEPRGWPELDRLDEIDFVQTHHYFLKDVAAELERDRVLKAAARVKPHYHVEFGIHNRDDETHKLDPNGVHLRNALFASVGQMNAGTPMTWWWDNYVEPQELYGIYRSFSGWVHGMDFVAQQVRPVEARIVLPEGEAVRSHEDEFLRPWKESCEPAAWNREQTLEVTRAGELRGAEDLSSLLHGTELHRELWNPVTFRVNAPKKTAFGVIVRTVSGYGGGRLEISLDGRKVRTEDFRDPDDRGDTADIHRYDGPYEIEVPPGRHTIRVENTGRDWIRVGYRVPWLQGPSPLRVFGVVGESQARVWIQNRQHTWEIANRSDHRPVEVADARLELLNWPRGRWTIGYWDTQKGVQTNIREVRTTSQGVLVVPLPPIATDLALRCERR